ncbi:hypothetical protein CYMTET_18780 [Cymbomonas tetramitiformis]|uniref:Uncharacterized protein n=1 Tax=Cymbomonas tetramitiformis TaxID=36881 RepID=A0AAE0G7S7_9CHLO|nr:hypothetical protein CYMTET_18780 [Cymbomonas tetramitiformis]
MVGSTDSPEPGDPGLLPSGRSSLVVAVSPPKSTTTLEMEMLRQQMRNEQEAHEEAMKTQAAARMQQDLQTQLLAEQIVALRADVAKALAEKEEATSSTTSTGDAELEKLKKLPYCPYAEVNPFLTRPDTLTDGMPKLLDLHVTRPTRH